MDTGFSPDAAVYVTGVSASTVLGNETSFTNVLVVPNGVAGTVLLDSVNLFVQGIMYPAGFSASAHVGVVEAVGVADVTLFGVQALSTLGDVSVQVNQDFDISGVIAYGQINYAAATIWNRIPTSGNG